MIVINAHKIGDYTNLYSIWQQDLLSHFSRTRLSQ